MQRVFICEERYIKRKSFGKENSDSKVETSIEADPNVVDKDGNGYKTLEQLQAEADASKIGADMPSNPTFQDGTSKGEINISNTSTNGNAFTVAFQLKETGEEVYKSGLIESGKTLQYGTLSKDLDPGTYPAVAVFTTYNEDGSEKGKVGLEIIISVLS